MRRPVEAHPTSNRPPSRDAVLRKWMAPREHGHPAAALTRGAGAGCWASARAQDLHSERRVEGCKSHGGLMPWQRADRGNGARERTSFAEK